MEVINLEYFSLKLSKILIFIQNEVFFKTFILNTYS